MQTQVLPYLRELQKPDKTAGPGTGGAYPGARVRLLTFEPRRSSEDLVEFEKVRERLKAEGIEWNWLPYHKRPSSLATGWDILNGALKVHRESRRDRPDIIHARVHVPALMAALGTLFLRKNRPRILFDIRGFFPEEYTDAGIWKEGGILYRVAKRVEKWLFSRSDGFVVLTEKARKILFPESAVTGSDRFGRPVAVIPCCVDFQRLERPQRFDDALAEKKKRFTSVYVGSFGGWYMTNEMIDFFAEAKSETPDAFAIVLTQREHEKIEGMFRARGFADTDFFVGSVRPDEVFSYISGADVAISFIKPCYSKLSSSPTKIAEYLAAGLPVIANSGVGDVADVIEEHRVGAVIGRFDSEDYAAAIDRVRKLANSVDLQEHCKTVARKVFGLQEVAGPSYRDLYCRILEEKTGGKHRY